MVVQKIHGPFLPSTFCGRLRVSRKSLLLTERFISLSEKNLKPWWKWGVVSAWHILTFRRTHDKLLRISHRPSAKLLDIFTVVHSHAVSTIMYSIKEHDVGMYLRLYFESQPRNHVYFQWLECWVEYADIWTYFRRMPAVFCFRPFWNVRGAKWIKALWSNSLIFIALGTSRNFFDALGLHCCWCSRSTELLSPKNTNRKSWIFCGEATELLKLMIC